jgi:hypothetical protein
MSERYKPKDLLRARGTSPVKTQPKPTAIDYHQQLLRKRTAERIGGSPVECSHGVPWVDCTICSKPIKR